MDELWLLAVSIWSFRPSTHLHYALRTHRNQIPLQRNFALQLCRLPSILSFVERFKYATLISVKTTFLIFNLIIFICFAYGSVIGHSFSQLSVIDHLPCLHLSNKVSSLHVLRLWHFEWLNCSPRILLEQMILHQHFLKIILFRNDIHIRRWYQLILRSVRTN